jgi:hypothetical protein
MSFFLFIQKQFEDIATYDEHEMEEISSGLKRIPSQEAFEEHGKQWTTTNS